MLQHLPALFVILVLATTVFAFASRPASEMMRRADFTRRRNLWFAFTLTLFLANSAWIYFLVVVMLMFLFWRQESNPVALFFFLIFVAPPYQAQISGMGLTNFLFNISHQRLLSLVILLPAFFVLLNQKNTLSFGKAVPDKLLAAYIILITILDFREPSITNTLRHVFYHFTDIFLPYYVISRFITNTRVFREALTCFVIAVMIIALIGIFETLRDWHVYNSLRKVFGLGELLRGGMLIRGDFLRASAGLGPIPLGYVITVAMGLFLYLQNCVQSKLSRQSGLLLLVTGLLSSLSRGPWVGAVFLYLVFVATGKKPAKLLIRFGIGSIVALSLLAVSPTTMIVVDLIPYYGSSEEGAGTIGYRERLIDKALIVINRHPLFGSIDYLDTPEMESLREGHNIIDVVNTYIQVALKTGLIGLGLFTGIFLTIFWGILRSLRRLTDKNSEEGILGRSLLATLAAILMIIFTVSSISIIPIVYWSVAGLGVAYINMLNPLRKEQNLNLHS